MILVLQLIKPPLLPLPKLPWKSPHAIIPIPPPPQSRLQYIMRIVNGRIRHLEIAAEVGEPDDGLGDAKGGLDGAEA